MNDLRRMYFAKHQKWYHKWYTDYASSASFTAVWLEQNRPKSKRKGPKFAYKTIHEEEVDTEAPLYESCPWIAAWGETGGLRIRERRLGWRPFPPHRFGWLWLRSLTWRQQANISIHMTSAQMRSSKGFTIDLVVAELTGLEPA